MSSNNTLLQERISELENAILEYKNNQVHVISFSSRERLIDCHDNSIKCFSSYGIYENTGLNFDKCKDTAVFIIKNETESYIRTNKEIYTSFEKFITAKQTDNNSTDVIIDCSKNINTNYNNEEIFDTILAIDFETANEMHDKACSVGISIYKNGEITLNKEYLINPQTSFNQMNINIHGITASMVKDADIFPKVWSEIVELIDDSTLVIAHNAAFDITLLKKLFSIYKCDDIEFKYLCTHKLYRNNIALEKYNLKYVANYINEEFEHHKAIDDSLICLKAFIHLMSNDRPVSKEFIENELNTLINTFIMTDTDKSYTAKVRKTGGFRSFSNNFKPSDLIPKNTNFDQSHPVFGKTFVFSGELPSFDSKKDAAQKIVDLGGIFKGSLVKTTNYLVVGVDINTGTQMSGSKVQKVSDYNAKGCSIEIISEYDLLSLLNSTNTLQDSIQAEVAACEKDDTDFDNLNTEISYSESYDDISADEINSLIYDTDFESENNTSQDIIESIQISESSITSIKSDDKYVDIDVNKSVNIFDDKLENETDDKIENIAVNTTRSKSKKIRENTSKVASQLSMFDMMYGELREDSMQITTPSSENNNYIKEINLEVAQTLNLETSLDTEDINIESFEDDSKKSNKLELKNPLANFVIPREDFIQFADIYEKLEKLKQYKLVGVKASKIDKKFYYKGVYTQSPSECEIVGYLDIDVLVIKVNGSLHSIRGEYLKQMQDTTFSIFETLI